MTVQVRNAPVAVLQEYPRIRVTELRSHVAERLHLLASILKGPGGSSNVMAQEMVIVVQAVHTREGKGMNKDSIKHRARSNNPKLSVEEFVLLAIERLRDRKYRAIHTVFSGFNRAFRVYYREEGLDPVEEVGKLVQAGKIKLRYVKGGALISADPNFKGEVSPAEALRKMNLA
ncbi:MAG: hypothetical protein Q8R13_03985 [bacterium]|nr:hypothetical protein [bacterium]